MQDDIEVCPTCGALPCDQVNRPDDTIASLRETNERLNSMVSLMSEHITSLQTERMELRAALGDSHG